MDTQSKTFLQFTADNLLLSDSEAQKKLSNRKKHKRGHHEVLICHGPLLARHPSGSIVAARTQEHNCGTHARQLHLQAPIISITLTQEKTKHWFETAVSYSEGFLLQFLKDYQTLSSQQAANVKIRITTITKKVKLNEETHPTDFRRLIIALGTSSAFHTVIDPKKCLAGDVGNQTVIIHIIYSQTL